MSFLDLYQADQREALRPTPNEGHDLPATFGESFEAAWNHGRLFEQSTARENARIAALQDHLDEIKQKTGVDLADKLDWTADVTGVGPIPLPSTAIVQQMNTEIEKSGRSDIAPLDDEELDRRAVAKSRQSGADLAQIAAREHSGFGLLAGSLASAAADPINVLAAPVAPEAESVSILAAALRFGGVAAVSQAAIEAAGASYHEEVQPGYLQSAEPVANVVGAFGGGAVLGGALRALGNTWTRVKTGAWPTSIRDAGNIVESHANVAESNVYLGAEGEAAHWDAMNFAIDSALNERLIDVTDIITPQIEEQSRNLLVRLNAERAPALPAFNERSVRLLSEEADLRARDADLAASLEKLPAGDETAADRLNRLNAINQQIEQADNEAARKKLLERRDQVLVDTTPEKLADAAAPIEQRRQANAERAAIADRLDAISKERTQARADALGVQPVNIGQAEPVRQMPLEQLRQMAQASASLAERERAASPPTELPFAATAAEGQARASFDALSEGVTQIAAQAGYAMPKDEANTVAAAMVKMTPDQAADATLDLRSSPRQVVHTVNTPPQFPQPAERPMPDAATLRRTLDAPDQEKALSADIDRERMTADRQIPVDVDKDGNVVYRSLDSMADDVAAYQKAADELAACAVPVVKEATNG